MFFLLSGEGATDVGTGGGTTDVCQGADFAIGPMCVVVEQVVVAAHGYSILEFEACGLVPEPALVRRAAELKAVRKSVGLPGVKVKLETRYYFNNARVLARLTTEQGRTRGEPVVAVLFRDNDGTASAGRGAWSDKWRSMLNGFAAEGFARGVPMIPQPKSEAWLLCGLKVPPYHDCSALEAASGNDASPNSLKSRLAIALGVSDVGRELLVDVVRSRRLDIDRVDMPSFRAFRDRLEAVLRVE